MWIGFAVSIIFLVCALFAPGYAVLRVFGLSRIASLGCAPMLSIFAFCVLGVVYGQLGVPCSALTVLLPYVVVGAVMLCVHRIRRHHEKTAVSHSRRNVLNGLDGLLFAVIYMAISVIIAIVLIPSFIQSPEGFTPTYDNVFHYNVVRSFMDSGVWSCLEVTAYPVGVMPESSVSMPGSAYYPAAWHVLCALVATTCSVSAACAANAVNFVAIAFIFPSTMCLFMTCVFPKKRAAVLAGAFFTLAFSVFPWFLYFYWPLFPNALSLSVAPALVGVFLLVCSDDADAGERLRYAILFVLGVVCAVFMQPNIVFTIAVVLAPFCVWRAFRFAAGYFEHDRHRLAKAGVFGCLAIVAIAAAWIACYKMPFLQDLVNYYWEPVMSFAGGLASALDLSFVGSRPQYLLAALVVMGALYSFRMRQYMWMTVSFAVACVIFAVASSLGDIPIKHLLAGFWYTDPYRIAAFSVVMGVPLASLGCCVLLKVLKIALARLKGETRSILQAVVSTVAAVVFMVANYGFCAIQKEDSDQNAFDHISSYSFGLYELEESWVYDQEEIDFVQDVQSLIPEGALVINQPYDGSILAYFYSGLNTYYRSVSGYTEHQDSEESWTIRNGLSRYANDASVQAAVKKVGAEYVLILDRDSANLKSTYGMYKPQEWAGIDAITDATEGFEVVLSRDGMTLYRICAQ